MSLTIKVKRPENISSDPHNTENGEKCAEISFNNGKLIFSCTICQCPPNYIFPSFYELQDHLFIIHFAEYLKKSDVKVEKLSSPIRRTSVDENLNSKITDKRERTEIVFDGFSDSESIELINDLKTESLFEEEIEIPKKLRTKRKKRDPEKPKRQGDWHRVYKTLTVDGDTRYQCEYEDCNKHFRTRNNLRLHERIHKINFKPYPCEHCGKVFRDSRQLGDHVRTHTGEKPYKCDCGTYLRTMSALINHRKQHAGIKNFQCQYCETKFLTKEIRIAHERTHTGEKPFVCDVCGEKYITKSRLGAHRVVHFKHQIPKAFACNLCTAKFHGKKLLRNHINDVHLCVKNHICNICQSAYKRKFQLDQHVKIHNGTNEYSCNICGQEFVKYSRVRDHLRLQHQLNAKNNYTFTPANVTEESTVQQR